MIPIIKSEMPEKYKITKEDIRALSLHYSREGSADIKMSSDMAKRIDKMVRWAEGKTKLGLLIRGTIFNSEGKQNYFTYIHKEYELNVEGAIENALDYLEFFECFMMGWDKSKDVFFSEPEQQWVSRNVIATANYEIYLA